MTDKPTCEARYVRAEEAPMAEAHAPAPHPGNLMETARARSSK